MTNKTITAFFDSFNDAADAVRRLENAGIQHEDISLVANNEGDRYSEHASGRTHASDSHTGDGAGTGATVGTLAGGGAGLLAGLGMLAIPGLGPVVAAGWLVSTLVGAGAGAAVGGLAGSLVGAGVDERDAHAYAEGVKRGGALVTVRATETMVDRIVDILDDDGTVDLDNRQTSWQSEGRSSGDTAGGLGGMAGRNTGIGAAASTTTGMTTGDLTSDADFDSTRTGRTGLDSTTGGPLAGGSTAAGMTGATESRGTSSHDRDDVIPVAEEELHVGKREVTGGRVRIHSHVVERPVNEQVNLRQEHVEVERRPVEGSMRAGTMDDDELFRERTVEMEERSEEPVVSKDARVREELVVRKEVDQRTETVSDKVRRTEVEVEDERGNRITGTNDTDRRR
jgi:stress response protein YsnF